MTNMLDIKKVESELIKSEVKLKVSHKGGRLEFTAKSGKGSSDLKGQEVPVEMGLLYAIQEMVFILAVSGFENKIQDSVNKGIEKARTIIDGQDKK